MNRIIVFKWNVSWIFPLPAPSGCTGNGGTEKNISKKPHGHSPGAPGGRWSSCLCAAPLSHRSNPHNPSLCPCMSHEGSLLCFSLSLVARDDIPSLTTPMPCTTLAFSYCLQGNKIFCLCCFFSLAHLWVSAVACSSCCCGIIIAALCKELYVHSSDSTACIFPPHAIKEWDVFFKATQPDLYWFIAFFLAKECAHFPASLGKLSHGLQVIWSSSSSSALISFSPSLSQPTGSSSGCVFKPLFCTSFFHMGSAAPSCLPFLDLFSAAQQSLSWPLSLLNP